MGWRFRDRYKIAPGFYMNLSNSGISFTVGPKGFNINHGKRGTFLNTSVPGTGLYRRDHIDGKPRKAKKKTAIPYRPSDQLLYDQKIAAAEYFVDVHEREIESTHRSFEKGIYEHWQYEAKVNELLGSKKYLEMKGVLLAHQERKYPVNEPEQAIVEDDPPHWVIHIAYGVLVVLFSILTFGVMLVLSSVESSKKKNPYL